MEGPAFTVAKILLGRYVPSPPCLTASERVSNGGSLGQDLAGNTYWEFRDSLNSGRFRRIVKYNPKTHYGDVKVNREYHVGS